MKFYPLVSVIIPTYNAEDFIESTINSIINQDYTNWELIIIDDCSTDETVKKINQLTLVNSKIKLLILDKNCGSPAKPRNIGIKIAKGEWIAFLDADDIWHHRKLSIQFKAINETNALFCSTNMIDFKQENSINFDTFYTIKKQYITFKSQLIKHKTPLSSVIVKKNLLLKFPFNESKEYKAREDFDCFLHIHEHIKFSIKILQPLLYYRVSDIQISRNKWKMLKKNYMVLSEYKTKHGSKLGFIRYYYWFTQLFLSFYFRFIKKEL